MADDLNDLGTTFLWRPDPGINWREVPNYNFDFARIVKEFAGTAVEFDQLSSLTPHDLTFLLSFFDKTQEKSIIEQFIVFKGRHERFWFPHPANLFELFSNISLNDTEIEVVENGFDYQGFERIYFLLKNGDFITHYITASVVDTVNKKITFTINTQFDRGLTQAEILLFSLLPLCRMDMDNLELNHQTSKASESTVKLKELVLEYSEI